MYILYNHIGQREIQNTVRKDTYKDVILHLIGLCGILTMSYPQPPAKK